MSASIPSPGAPINARLERLVAEFEVARVTVRQAVDRLTRDGLVSPQRGRGTFVTRGAARRPLAARRDLATEPRRRVPRHAPDRAQHRRVQAQPAPDRRRWRAGAEVRLHARIHAHQGRPYCVIDIYLDAEIFARHPARFRKETVIPLLTANVALETILPIVLHAKPQGLLFEASNPRHAHEWETIAAMKASIPDDKILIPGVLDSTTNFSMPS